LAGKCDLPQFQFPLLTVASTPTTDHSARLLSSLGSTWRSQQPDKTVRWRLVVNKTSDAATERRRSRVSRDIHSECRAPRQSERSRGISSIATELFASVKIPRQARNDGGGARNDRGAKHLTNLNQAVEDAHSFTMHCGRFHKSLRCRLDRSGGRRPTHLGRLTFVSQWQRRSLRNRAFARPPNGPYRMSAPMTL